MDEKHLESEGPVFEYQPGPQSQFAACRADIAFFGGAAGGGKSYALLLEALKDIEIPGYSAVIFRRTYSDIHGGGGLWDESASMYTEAGAESRSSPYLGWSMRGGGKVQFSHLQHEKDMQSHQGRQYAFIGFDEVTHFTSKQFWFLLTRLRSTCGTRPYVRATCNPDPESFVRKLIDWWIGPDGYAIPERSGVLRYLSRSGDELVWTDEREDPDQISVTFIPSKLEDNKKLLEVDPRYAARLKSLDKVTRERMLGANWDIKPSSGLYFQRSYFEYVDAPPPATKIVRAWDKAATKVTPQSPDPDWTVGVKMGRLSDGRFCIYHAEMFRDGPMGVRNRVRNIAEMDGKKVRQVFWQDPGAAGKSDVQDQKRELAGHIVSSYVASKNKVTYAEPFSAQCEAGNVLIVNGPWVDTYLRQLEAFPSKNTHDDAVDASSLAFKELVEKGSLGRAFGNGNYGHL